MAGAQSQRLEPGGARPPGSGQALQGFDEAATETLAIDGETHFGVLLAGGRAPPVGDDLVGRFVATAAESGIDVFRLHDPLNDMDNLRVAADDGNPMGTPEAEIHWQVDVSGQLETKRAALAAHASQRTDVGFFLSLPPEAFAASFGTEYYIEPGLPPGMRSGWVLGEQAPDRAPEPPDRAPEPPEPNQSGPGPMPRSGNDPTPRGRIES